MSSTKKTTIQQSIHDYLSLTDRSWVVEFEVFDFGASLTSCLELPPLIYAMSPKAHFWAFMHVFLQTCEISFIERRSLSENHVEMALVGLWNFNLVAIPLWILHKRLLGFEVIQSREFEIIDSIPLKWSRTIHQLDFEPIQPMEHLEYIFENDIYINNRLYLRVDNKRIFISEEIDEQEFFERIAKTDIPELDDFYERQ